MRQSLNFNHLECFFSVAHTLSFSTTSKELGIAQPAVSKQVKSLEVYFERQLFIRTRQKVSLTPFGAEVYENLYPLYCELCDRVTTILDDQENIRGKLHIASLQEVGEKLLIPLISQFKKNHSNISIDFQLLKGHEIVDKVKSGQVEVGIVAQEVIRENIRCYKVLREEIVLVTRNENRPVGKVNLRELSYVAYRKDDPLLQSFLQENAPHTKTKKLNIEFTVNSHRSMVNLLKEHPFYAVLPKVSVEKEIEQKELVVVDDFTLTSYLYLIHQDVDYMDQKIALFTDYLKKQLKEQKRG
ncbi:MAG: hypothetical protein CME63_04445 [Halobacteriovoraceae bacterium]|nr:hypothetical protein [Halobacteriovoraceae bacterium]|tara:strand:- start:20923 stop:21819 length:897 start_codon:yes stop_codon:yes gene_type:complete